MSNNILILPEDKRPSKTGGPWKIQFRAIVLATPNGKWLPVGIGINGRKEGRETVLLTAFYGELSNPENLQKATDCTYMIYVISSDNESGSDAAKAISSYLNINTRISIDKRGTEYWWRVVIPKKTVRHTTHDVDTSDSEYYIHDNPWIDILGQGEESETAYWNTD